MSKLALLILLPLYTYGMQTTLTIDEKTHFLGISRPLPILAASPSEFAQESLPLRSSFKPSISPDIDGVTSDKLKIWILGTIAQYEEKHSLTLQQLQTALDQHATTVSATANTAQSAQNTSKYAVYAAIATGTCSIIVCIASSLLSHYL